MVNVGPLKAEIGLPVWDTPAHFNGFRVSGFAKVVVERCGFHHWIAQTISWGGGLRFSLSLIVSELWRLQWRHNERCGLHPRPWTK